ncbi:hypothetical protein RHSIM_Rhsim12G0147600 [Rhododendron simsii]|uniref:Nop domain-containing protein n=1 Tax=Rhododendron simsii TaxID=118357 RepID=A0A834G4V6_RHOSS|nr:hypothetical protein RHSIM_Rhsim12G0147600 [Rhododendron simsii]
MRACRLLAGKSILAARMDSVSEHPTGNRGRALRDKIHKTIEMWQEPPPAKRPKPLLVPDCKPKKKRGGRRLRRTKQRYAITDMRKMANRIQFGVAEETYLGDGIGEGYGMVYHCFGTRQLGLRIHIQKFNVQCLTVRKMKIFFYFVTFVTPHPILSVCVWEPLSQKVIGFAMTAMSIKLEHDKSDTPLSFRSLGERPLVEELASILAIRRELWPRVLERPPTRVSAYLNNLSTPIPSETRTNPDLGARMLRHFPKSDDTKLRNVEGGATSSGRSNQPHCSGNNVSERGSYDVVKAWKMLDAAKSMEQVHGKTRIVLKSSKDNLSKVITPVGKARPSSSLLVSSSKPLQAKDLAKNRSRKHNRCYSSVQGSVCHKPQIDVRQRQGIITPKRILKFNEISPGSQSPGDHIHASVLDNVCDGNVRKPTEGRLRAQPADGLHEHDGSVWLVSPAGPVTSGSNSTSAKLEVALSSYMGLPNEKARMEKSCAGSKSIQEDDAKNEIIQSLVKLNLKLTTRDRPIASEFVIVKKWMHLRKWQDFLLTPS